MFSISGWSVVAAYISNPQNCNIAELTVRNVYQSVNSYNWFYKNGSCKDGKKPCIVVWHQLTMYVKWARLDEFITYCMGRPTSCIPQVQAGKTVLSLGHENVGIRLHIYMYFFSFFFFLIGYAASKKIIHKKLFVKKYT